MKANEDIEFLNYLIEMDNILRTTGWQYHLNWCNRLDEIVQILDDNGFDTLTRALYRGYGYEHPLDKQARITREKKWQQQADNDCYVQDNSYP